MKIVYLLGIFFLLIPLLLSFLIREIPNDIQASLEATQMISKDLVITQFFTSQMDNLSGIGTSIKNPNFRNHKKLLFNLLEDKAILRTVVLNGSSISDGDFMKIKFEPISNSKDKKYSFQLSAPDATSEDSLEIFLTSQKPSWIGELYANSSKSDLKIPFITYHKRSNLLSVSNTIFIQNIQKLFADLAFAVFYAILIGGLVGYLLHLNKKK